MKYLALVLSISVLLIGMSWAQSGTGDQPSHPRQHQDGDRRSEWQPDDRNRRKTVHGGRRREQHIV